MNIKRDDTVLVIAGKDRGKKGRVREVHPADNAVLVEGINIIKKHTRGTQGARLIGPADAFVPDISTLRDITRYSLRIRTGCNLLRTTSRNEGRY